MGNIKVEQLSKIYSDGDRRLTILNDISCEFTHGVSYGIVGRSGVGKSTFLHILAGLDSPSSGTVRLGDENISAMTPDERASLRASRIGFIFQAHYLLPEFSAVENVAMPLLISGVSESEATERAALVLTSVGLHDRVSHLPSMLSGGEQQRVAIARALVADPEILLADEPTGSLDVATAAEVQSLLIGVQRERKVTLVVVTHSSDFAGQMDVVLRMEVGGKLCPVP